MTVMAETIEEEYRQRHPSLHGLDVQHTAEPAHRSWNAYGARVPLRLDGRRALFTLPLAWLLGSLVGLNAAASSSGTLGAALWFMFMGSLVLANARISLPVTTGLAALLGLFHGALNGSGLGLSLPAVIATLGVAAGVFVLVAVVAAFISQLRAHWARIAVRVGGSWIAASGLLVAGWAFRGA